MKEEREGKEPSLKASSKTRLKPPLKTTWRRSTVFLSPRKTSCFSITRSIPMKSQVGRSKASAFIGSNTTSRLGTLRRARSLWLAVVASSGMFSCR